MVFSLWYSPKKITCHCKGSFKPVFSSHNPPTASSPNIWDLHVYRKYLLQGVRTGVFFEVMIDFIYSISFTTTCDFNLGSDKGQCKSIGDIAMELSAWPSWSVLPLDTVILFYFKN